MFMPLTEEQAKEKEQLKQDLLRIISELKKLEPQHKNCKVSGNQEELDKIVKTMGPLLKKLMEKKERVSKLKGK